MAGLFNRASQLPPRPDYVAVGSAILVALVVYMASLDSVAAIAAAVTVGLLVFPVAFVVREAAVLAKHSVDQRSAENVYEWLKNVTVLLGITSVSLAYTSRNGISGVQVVGLGLVPRQIESLASSLHRAAWHAAPVAKIVEGGGLVVVVPGYIMARLSELVVRNGKTRKLVVSCTDDLKLLYNTLKPIVKSVVSNTVFAAYLTVKLIGRMLKEGLIVLALEPEDLEKAERLLPFENPIIKLMVKRQLALEGVLSLS